MIKKGRYKLTNPNKYKGNPKNVIYRSGWEKMVMKKLDTSTKVIEWASEEIPISYRSPIDRKLHKYYPDFWVKLEENKIILIEVKPNIQTKPPRPRENKRSRKYLKELRIWKINEAKWRAAKGFCDDKGWTFLIQDEYDLGIKKKRNGKQTIN